MGKFNLGQHPETRWAARLLSVLLGLGLLLASVLATPVTARAADTRAVLHVSSFVDEPSWAFADREVTIQLDVYPNQPGAVWPTGVLRVVPDNVVEPVPTSLTRLMADGSNYYVSLPKNTVGDHSYTVKWAGDAKYQPFSIRFSYEVIAGPDTATHLSVTDSTGHQPTQVTKGSAVFYRVHVTNKAGRELDPGFNDGGDADGAPIQFFDNGQLTGDARIIDTGRWSGYLSTSALNIGTHRITAENLTGLHYSGSVSNAITFKVVAPLPAVKGTITVSPSGTVAFGKKITGTATIAARTSTAPIPTGSVQFFDWNAKVGAPVKLVDGKASFGYPTTLKRGKHILQAQYLGNSAYPASFTNAATVTIV